MVTLNSTPRVALYARVSTTDQSTDSQLLDLRRYVSDRGWLTFREYVDEGISGTKDSRPALNELMNDARKRRFDVVLVWRFDRFARSTKHLILALEEFRNMGIDFVSYQENIDTTQSTGSGYCHDHQCGGSVGAGHYCGAGEGWIEKSKEEREEVGQAKVGGGREGDSEIEKERNEPKGDCEGSERIENHCC